MRRRRVAVAALALGLFTAAPAAAQSAQERQQRITELGLEVAVGFEGRARTGAWQPVAITIEPVRPVAGTLTVESRVGSNGESIGVEVAAGSRKVYRFVQPPGQLRVAFEERGADVLSVSPGNAPATTEYVVGLLGEQPQSLPPLRSETTGQSGAWVALDPAWVETSAQALQSLSTVVAEDAAVRDLTTTGRANLSAAVAAGLDLVVVRGGDANLRGLGLPFDLDTAAWQLRGGDLAEPVGALDDVIATAVPAGRGRVLVASAELGGDSVGRSAEVWSMLTQPAARLPGEQSDFRITSAPFQFSRLFAESGQEAPALPGLGLFVLVYVLVVGPVNALILGRLGRRELAWATIPLITVIFTTGAFFGATAGRPASGGAARLTYWADGAATEFVAGGLRATTQGRRTMTLPGTDWTVRALVDSGRRSTSIVRNEDTTVSLNLSSLQIGGVAAWRTMDAPPPLEVTAVATGRGIKVDVANVSGRPLRDIVVRTATTNRRVGNLAPGARDSTVVQGDSLPLGNAYRDPFEGLPFDDDGLVSPPTSLRAVFNTEIADGTPGMVWVSAEDHTAASVDATAGDDPVRDLGSLVAVGEQIESRPPPVSPYAVVRTAFSDSEDEFQPGPEAVETNGELFLRYRLPAGTRPADLVNQLNNSAESGGNATLSVWDRRQRQWVLDSDAFTGDRSRLLSPLGEVWVRVNGELFPFEYSARTVVGGAS